MKASKISQTVCGVDIFHSIFHMLDVTSAAATEFDSDYKSYAAKLFSQNQSYAIFDCNHCYFTLVNKHSCNFRFHRSRSSRLHWHLSDTIFKLASPHTNHYINLGNVHF